MTESPTPRSVRAEERAARRASRRAQTDRLRAARLSERAEVRADRDAARARMRASGELSGRTTALRVAVASGRVVVGLVGVAATVLILGGVAFVEWPSWGVSAPVSDVAPAASAQQRMCAGPFMTVGAVSANAGAISSIGPSTIQSTGGVRDALSTANPNAERDGFPQRFSSELDGEALAATQWQRLAGEAISGLTVAACSPPAAESWIVGGGTTLGETAVLSIANPSDVAADVRIELFGLNGSIDAPGLGGLLVQPGEQVNLPMTGYAPDEAHLVVHVSSLGGQVSALLDVSRITGIVPVGADTIAASVAPAEQFVIPGFVVGSPVSQADVLVRDDAQPTLRLLAPLDAATADVTVRNEQSGVERRYTARLSAGAVMDLPLSGLAAGSYSVAVVADRPIVGAARSALTAPEGTDFAWFASAAPLSGDVPLAIPNASPATLHLRNTTRAPVSISIATGKTVMIPASAAIAVPVPAGNSTLSAMDGLVASVSFQAAGEFASFVVPGAAVAPGSVSVYTR